VGHAFYARPTAAHQWVETPLSSPQRQATEGESDRAESEPAKSEQASKTSVGRSPTNSGEVAVMVSVTQNVALVAAAVLGSLLFMLGLNRVWSWEKRRPHNDLIGWQLSVLGTTYAVILASCSIQFGPVLAKPT
jgi:hypothetical protein